MSTGNLQATLKDSGTSASDGRKNETLRTALVISEVALACVLLVGAGLLLHSFLHVLDVDLGFSPAQPAATLQPLQQIVDHATSPRRFFAVLVAIFAALGLILASLGIYGVISYSVTRQTQEIGIRMALGASQASVQRRILKATLRMTVIGVAIGTVASLTMSKLIASLLFATEATDPTTFAATVAILIGVALIAAYLPARRASRINPMTALRSN